MNSRSVFTSLMIGLLLISCTKNPHNRYEEKNISNQGLSINISMRYPFRIRQYDSVVYLMDLHGNNKFVHILTYPELIFVKSIATKGIGPEELNDSENIRVNSNCNLWILDANNMQLICINDSGQKRINLAKSLIRTLDFDIYNDSLFIVPDYTGKYRYRIVNSHGEIVENRGKIPKRNINKEKSDIALAQAWRSFIDYNPDNGILAMVTQLGEVVELYNVKNDSLICTYKGKNGEPVYNTKNGVAIPDGIMGYSDVQVGSKYIYALFWGYKLKSIREGKVKTEGGNQIQVFDLNGKHVKTFILDRYITGFHIDETKQLLLALDPNSNQPLIKYSLSES